MNWDLFKEYFHESWHKKMQPFIESEACDDIYKYLKSESKRGKKIAPLSSVIYRCFKETPLDDVKVVMIGMCPYHTFYNNEPVADGLLMGCSVTNRLQPSLEKFYEGVEKELFNGLNFTHQKLPDVSYLAKQGVLMFNAALTTEMNKAGSHIELWEPFTKYVLEEILTPLGVPTIFLGKDASKYEKYTSPFAWNIVLSHPASAAYKQTDWDTEGKFTMVNKILKDNNDFEIMWLYDVPF
jgi:uracil-DNA glycosylase